MKTGGLIVIAVCLALLGTILATRQAPIRELPEENPDLDSRGGIPSGTPLAGTPIVRKSAKRSRQRSPMQTVRSKEWRIAQELKEYLQDPEMLVIDEIARSEKASPHRNSSDWIIRALGNVDGRQRLHALMRDRETGKMFDAAYQRTGDEAFSRNNRPRIQFTSFRPFRRAAEPDGDQARYPEFQIVLQATFRLTYFK